MHALHKKTAALIQVLAAASAASLAAGCTCPSYSQDFDQNQAACSSSGPDGLGDKLCQQAMRVDYLGVEESAYYQSPAEKLVHLRIASGRGADEVSLSLVLKDSEVKQGEVRQIASAAREVFLISGQRTFSMNSLTGTVAFPLVSGKLDSGDGPSDGERADFKVVIDIPTTTFTDSEGNSVTVGFDQLAARIAWTWRVADGECRAGYNM